MSIYLDSAATTYVYPEVAEIVKFYNVNNFYNPSATYSAGKNIKKELEGCRKSIAEMINAEPEEIYFTSGGTESDNWACSFAKKSGKHIITSTIEHKAILETLKNYKNVTYVKTDKEGFINPYSVRNAIKNDTVMITIMMANNEIGTIEPVDEIGKIASESNLIFHTDAVQAFGHINIDVQKSEINMLSASSHKFHGPKGCGFLYASKNIGIEPFIYGGGQENGMRSGTENIPGIMGMVKAAEISYGRMKLINNKMEKINKYIVNRLLNEVDGCIYNGSRTKRLSNNINLCFSGIDGTALLTLLDIKGIYASGASACNSRERKSHVLTAIGVPEEYIRGSIRMTLDERIDIKHAEYVVENIKRCVAYLRNK